MDFKTILASSRALFLLKIPKTMFDTRGPENVDSVLKTRPSQGDFSNETAKTCFDTSRQKSASWTRISDPMTEDQNGFKLHPWTGDGQEMLDMTL